ncbi:hypothetical protein DFQ27_009733 [Actinomortierella ambigua]|uniref:Uncharacterized protein n=1 Tax=Actinomortierella ambigua TaxID=1343610 RepID=A0A9P6QE54_9FUNG|nr:hypothetical protein DFQ27_009733 [Actinomortierella ambigua]
MAHLLAYSRVPFWKMPEHRLPTLGLYRQILKTVLALPTDLTCQPSKTGTPWRTPTPKPPTTKKASAIKTVGTTHEQDQPQQEEIQQLSIPLGPPGSHHPLPSPLRPFLFAWIRDRFRACQHCTSKRITARYLIEAEELLEKLEQAKRGDNEQVRQEFRDFVQGRTGILREVVERLYYMIHWPPGTTQRERHRRLCAAHAVLWDVRPKSSQERDARDYRNVFYYKIHLSPDLFSFPLPQDTHGQDLSIYPPPRPKNQRGKFKNTGGPYLTAVLTAHGSRFPRLRGGTLPPWMGAMFRKRMRRNHRDVDEWKLLEEWKVDMECEEELYRSLGVEDYGYDRPKDITED